MAEEALKQVEIYEEDCEMILQSLQTAHRFAVAHDLFNQYKNLAARVQPSPLTQAINRAAERLEGILDDHYAANEAEEDVSTE